MTWCVTLFLLAFYAILPPIIRASNVAHGTVYARSASVNLTGRVTHVTRSVTQCAWLCEADGATCALAEYQAERGVCVMSDVLPRAPVHAGLADPRVDLTSPDPTSQVTYRAVLEMSVRPLARDR
jgi:hypothetical protein